MNGAFHRDDIGDIDLFRGDSGVGLRHIIRRRREHNISIEPFLEKLPDVIEKGDLRITEKGSFEIWYQNHLGIIYPVFKGNKLTFVFTAYRQKKPLWMKKKSLLYRRL